MAKQNSGETEVETEVKAEVEAKFTISQLLNSKKYSNTKDVLRALLREDERYTHAQVSKLIEDFMKGEIK